MPALTVQNAEIKTATVEVRTLTISGKQVTLAVFRQLIEDDLIDMETATFRGNPWGTVNYCPGRACADLNKHRHVVWQAGTELRRSTVREPQWWRKDFFPAAGDAFIQAQFCANTHERLGWMKDDRGEVSFLLDGVRCFANTPDRPWRNSNHQCLSDGPSLDDVRRDVAIEQELRKAIEQRWHEVIDLPQLFIAV